MLPGQLSLDEVPGFARGKIPPASATVKALQIPPASSTLKGGKIPPASSTLKGGKIPPVSSTLKGGKIPPASSTFEEVDRRRHRAKISVQRLLAEARVDKGTWYDLKNGRRATHGSTIERLDRALARLIAGEHAMVESVLTGWYRYIIGDIARALGVEIVLAQAIACDPSADGPRAPHGITAARVRRLAIYTLVTACGQRNVDVARAAGCTRQAVGKTIAEIEALREADRATDELLARCAGLLQP